MLASSTMATRTTFTMDDSLAEQARLLGVNVSAAARDGVAAAVLAAQLEHDRAHEPEHGVAIAADGCGARGFEVDQELVTVVGDADGHECRRQ